MIQALVFCKFSNFGQKISVYIVNTWLGTKNLQQDHPVTFLWISIYYISANMSTKVRCRVWDGTIPILRQLGGWGQNNSNFCPFLLTFSTINADVRKRPKKRWRSIGKVPMPEEGSRILDTNPVKVGQNAVHIFGY